MEYIIHETNGLQIAEVKSGPLLIKSPQDFLDMIANISARTFILQEEMLDASFFDLRTGVAGEILQKCSNYYIRLAIVGNFSQYESESLHDFMYESNKTGQILFVDTVDAAIDRFRAPDI
jgi:hypothetical protein